jgi:hypothetical protein
MHKFKKLVGYGLLLTDMEKELSVSFLTARVKKRQKFPEKDRTS